MQNMERFSVITAQKKLHFVAALANFTQLRPGLSSARSRTAPAAWEAPCLTMENKFCWMSWTVLKLLPPVWPNGGIGLYKPYPACVGVEVLCDGLLRLWAWLSNKEGGADRSYKMNKPWEHRFGGRKGCRLWFRDRLESRPGQGGGIECDDCRAVFLWRKMKFVLRGD